MSCADQQGHELPADHATCSSHQYLHDSSPDHVPQLRSAARRQDGSAAPDVTARDWSGHIRAVSSVLLPAPARGAVRREPRDHDLQPSAHPGDRSLLRHRPRDRAPARGRRPPRLRRSPSAGRRRRAGPRRFGRRGDAGSPRRHRPPPDRRRCRHGDRARRRRARRPRRQCRDRPGLPYGTAPSGHLPAAAGGQRDRSTRRHPGVPAHGAARPGADRGDRDDRSPLRPTVRRRARCHQGGADRALRRPASRAHALGGARNTRRTGEHQQRGARQGAPRRGGGDGGRLTVRALSVPGVAHPDAGGDAPPRARRQRARGRR